MKFLSFTPSVGFGVRGRGTALLCCSKGLGFWTVDGFAVQSFWIRGFYSQTMHTTCLTPRALQKGPKNSAAHLLGNFGFEFAVLGYKPTKFSYIMPFQL